MSGQIKSGYVPITPEYVAIIRDEEERTGVSTWAMAVSVANAPAGFNAEAVWRWLYGGQKTAKADQLAFLLEAYRALPDGRKIEITHDMRERLKAEINRTGISPDRFVHVIANLPEGLSASKMRNIVFGRRLRRVSQEHLRFIEVSYAALPDGMAPFTRDMWMWLGSETARTGILSAAFVLEHSDKPQDLTCHLTEALFAGRLSDFPPRHWAFILARFQSFPDHKPKTAPQRRGVRQKTAKVALSDELRAKLNSELVRTGIGLVMLAQISGLTPPQKWGQIIHKWKSGRTIHANDREWRAVMDALSALPNRSVPSEKATRIMAHRPNHLPIADEDIEAIRFHRDRTGVGFSELVRAADAPKGLTPYTISSWLGKGARRAKPEYVRWVVERYEGMHGANAAD